MNIGLAGRSTVALSALCIMACAETPVVESATAPATARGRAVAAQPRARTLDEQFSDIGKADPRFAGVVVAPDGALVVQLAGIGSDEASVAAFRASPLGRENKRALRTASVRWSFLELSEARAYVENAADGLLVSSDIDEARNRIAFVVRDERALAQVRLLAGHLGARAAMFEIKVGASPRSLTSLRDFVRPVMGGLEIDMQQAALTCTLGLAVRYYGSNTDYVMTASHCTGTLNAVDSPMTLRQPTYWAADYPVLGAVGSEAVDPSLFYGMAMCNANRACRYSDAALFYANQTSVSSQVAHTTYSSSTPGASGSTTLAASPFGVSGAWTSGDLYVGMTVNKVGRTSGWTTGTISATCTRFFKYYPAVPQTHALECQTVASVTVMYGDSGSPVFTINGDGTNVTIAGILWGATDIYYDDADDRYDIFASLIFSSWTNLQTDLGSIHPRT